MIFSLAEKGHSGIPDDVLNNRESGSTEREELLVVQTVI